MLLLPKDCCLIPSKVTKNLFRQKRTYVLIIKMDLSMAFFFLKIEFVLNAASAQVVQVIKVDL